ncbi:MAG TPA: CFI-box-CTERM domain-containing protein [Nitrosopumilaceae archaeon]|nr:CFI-box-CTERM domain-containing protein [Nitrosopumilaceae archaeon]
MRNLLALAFFSLLLLPLNLAWAEYDSSHLRVPEISMTPTSGPPGTEITITVSNFPDTSNEVYPYPDFYVYLPFADAIGDSNVPGNCDGESCFPIYTYQDAQKGNFADKIITFKLFSTNNPKPVYLDNKLHTVCDVMVNNKAQQSFTDICSKQNQPMGDYEIKFAWGTITGEYDIVETMTFTVTEGNVAPEPESLRLDQLLMDLYANGTITEEEFEEELRLLGYTEAEIRQAKGILGKLPHQENADSPTPTPVENTENDDVTPIEDSDEKPDTTTPQNGCLIATAAFGSELAPQVQILRELRDNTLLKTSSGSSFMTAFNSFYYSFSPTVADWERQNPFFKEAVKLTITPLISTLSILNHVNIDSEAEMIGYGIGIILLNIGMYFVAPAIVVSQLNSKLKHKVRN